MFLYLDARFQADQDPVPLAGRADGEGPGQGIHRGDRSFRLVEGVQRIQPQKLLPDGARCGDFAMARGADAATATAGLPEGSWI